MMDRRKKDRKETDNKITFEVAYDVDQQYTGKNFYSETKNISTNGIKIQTDAQLPVGSLLKIQFKLAEIGKSTTVFGKVKWIKKPDDSDLNEVGLEFVSMPLKGLLAFIESISKT
jgi:hypothetical protein